MLSYHDEREESKRIEQEQEKFRASAYITLLAAGETEMADAMIEDDIGDEEDLNDGWVAPETAEEVQALLRSMGVGL